MRFHSSPDGESLQFSELDETDAGDGFDLAEGFNGGGGGGCFGDVDLDYGEGLALGDALRCGPGRVSGAAEGEVGDVEAVLAEDGADATDDAGDVVVANGDEGTVEWGFDVDAVVAEQTGRAAVEDRG